MTIAVERSVRYYDNHALEGEEMGQSDVHIRNIHYLFSVLKWLFRGQAVYVGSELNLYRTHDPKEIPICPDVVVIKGFEPPANSGADLPSYHIGEDGPPPALAIEVASPKTWKDDLAAKPALYAAFGVREYVAFDPNSRAVWTGKWKNPGRLWGWQLSESSHEMQELKATPNGRLWSAELESSLGVEERILHFYDQDGKLRLTEAETERERAETAQNRAETEQNRAEKLAAFLRQQGFDPDRLV